MRGTTNAATFKLEIGRLVERAKKRPELVMRKIAIDVFKAIIMKSPVKTGRFRGNWQAGLNEVAAGELEEYDPNGVSTVALARATVAGGTANDTFTLVNNLPYAWRLETGWSKQAPAGMVGITVAEFQNYVDAAAASIGLDQSESGMMPFGWDQRD